MEWRRRSFVKMGLDNLGSVNYDALRIMNIKDVENAEVSRTTEIGRSLQEFAKEAEFSARRGVVANLYPYIVAASKRMSARAIARYLEESHDVKVSPVTVAKAIRNPKKYWMFFFDTIEPYIRQIQDAHDVQMESLLFDELLFEQFCRTQDAPTHISASTPEERQQRLDEYVEAVSVVEEKWYGLDEQLRLEAKDYLEKQLADFRKHIYEEEK